MQVITPLFGHEHKLETPAALRLPHLLVQAIRACLTVISRMHSDYLIEFDPFELLLVHEQFRKTDVKRLMLQARLVN